MLAIRAACAALGSERLTGLDLYVTLEPCAMCAAAIAAARIARLCYGAPDPKSGGVEHGARVFAHRQAHHKPEVFGGIAEREFDRAPPRLLLRAPLATRPCAATAAQSTIGSSTCGSITRTPGSSAASTSADCSSSGKVR